MLSTAGTNSRMRARLTNNEKLRDTKILIIFRLFAKCRYFAWRHFYAEITYVGSPDETNNTLHLYRRRYIRFIVRMSTMSLR